MFIVRMDSPDHIQWVKGSSKFRTKHHQPYGTEKIATILKMLHGTHCQGTPPKWCCSPSYWSAGRLFLVIFFNPPLNFSEAMFLGSYPLTSQLPCDQGIQINLNISQANPNEKGRSAGLLMLYIVLNEYLLMRWRQLSIKTSKSRQTCDSYLSWLLMMLVPEIVHSEHVYSYQKRRV